METILIIAIGAVVALVILVPVIYVVGTLFRSAFAEFRARKCSGEPVTPAHREGYVDSLAWTLRWSEVMNTEAGESREQPGGPSGTAM